MKLHSKRSSEQETEEKGALRLIVILLAAIGLLTAIAVAVDMIYRKYKKCLTALNEEDTLDSLGDDCFEETPEEKPAAVDCDFSEEE